MKVAALELTSASRRAFERLAADLERVFATRFTALVAYGTETGLAFAESIRPDDLDALGPLVGTWHGEGLATPLVMTSDEFRRSLDAFPIEFQAILDRHLVIAGQPPFNGVRIPPQDLRHACEIQARSFLIHIRQGWLQCGGHHTEIDALVVRSAQPFRALLSNVVRLQGVAEATDEQLTDVAHRQIGLPVAVVRSLLELERAPDRAHDLSGRMPELLAAAETLWNFVDAWRAT